MGQLWGEKMERRQGEANTGSLCGELIRKWRQEDGTLCPSLLALCQDRRWWWGLGLHCGHSHCGLMREREGGWRGATVGGVS